MFKKIFHPSYFSKVLSVFYSLFTLSIKVFQNAWSKSWLCLGVLIRSALLNKSLTGADKGIDAL